jgi:hypothetical protein
MKENVLQQLIPKRKDDRKGLNANCFFYLWELALRIILALSIQTTKENKRQMLR